MRMPVSLPAPSRKPGQNSDIAFPINSLSLDLAAVHIGNKENIGMPCWYFDKQQLRETPSIRDGIPFETERRYRREGARFIMNCGTQMSLGHNTMATGVVYFHRFYMFHSFKNFPRYVTACCCLFLAGKVEETPKKCRDIIRTARTLLADNYFYSFGDDPKEEVMTLERILLQTIKFDLQVEHPYTFLLKYAKCLKGDQQKLQKMVQMAWNFVNDSLSTVVCLQWEPEIIAVALIHLASKLSKFTVVDWNGRHSSHTRWWDMFVADVTMDILEDICHQVLDLYQNNQKESNGPQSPPQLPPSRAELPKPAATTKRPTSSSTAHSPARKSSKLIHGSSSAKNAASSLSSSSAVGPPTNSSTSAGTALHGPNNTTNHIQPIRSLANSAPIPSAPLPHHIYRAPLPPATQTGSQHIQPIHSIYSGSAPPPPLPPAPYPGNYNLPQQTTTLQPPPPPPYPYSSHYSSNMQPMLPTAPAPSHSHVSQSNVPHGNTGGNYYHHPPQHHSRHQQHHHSRYGRQQRY